MGQPLLPPGRAPEVHKPLIPPLVAAAVVLFPLLTALRHLDDNSLTSWAWVLEGRNLGGLWALHLAAVGAAWMFSRRALPERWRLAAAVLAAFAAGVALSGEPEVVIDASRYFVQAKYLELFGHAAFFRAWGGELPAWTDLPLPAFLYGTIFRLCGEHRLPQQIFTAGLFAFTAFATARIGGLLWGAGTGARGALLLLAVPCLVVQVPLLLADVPAMAAVTAALWGLLETLERRGAWRVGAAALAVAAAFLAKYSTWVLLGAAAGAILLLQALRGRWAAAGRGTVALAAGALAPALFALLKPEVVQGQLALLAGFQWEGLRRWVESYPSTFLFQTHPLLAVAALAALWQGWRGRDPKVLVAAALPLVLFALGARRSRYLLPAFPMIALLAARGLEALPGRARRFAVLAAVGFSLVTVFAVYLPFLKWVNTANLEAAGRFLDARNVAVVEVTAQPSPGVALNPEVAVPLLDYHTAALVIVRSPTPPRPPQEELRASSFRFTWEQRLPSWYRDEAPAPAGAAQLLIAGDPAAPLPETLALQVPGRAPDAAFVRGAVYRYRTLVSIWLGDGR
ncbi:MAG: ArnT family glycosyltransferase [Candidatus Methylomirabilia bacterium]